MMRLPVFFSVVVMSALFSARASAGDVPLLHYLVKVEPRSWQPIEPQDVERILEAAVGSALSGAGKFRLVRTGYADFKKGDYALLIEGRFIEESEQFSTYLTFTSAQKAALPSAVASETAEIGKRQVRDMEKIIKQLAGVTAKRLADTLAEATETPDGSAWLQPEPWTWSEVKLDPPPTGNKAAQALCDPKNPDHVRAQAADSLKPYAVDQPAARAALEICVMRDPSPSIRAQCADGLASVAKQRIATQRILLAAMRQEAESSVFSRLVEISRSFVGLSRKEALATWLSLIASEATPGESADRLADVIADERSLPGLELVVARCLSQQALAYGRKQACASRLFPLVPKALRLSVAKPYLDSLRGFGQGETNAFDSIEGAFRELDAASAEAFLKVAERPSAGELRDNALYVAMRHPSPDEQVVRRVLALVSDPVTSMAALRALVDLVKTGDPMVPSVVTALRGVREKMTWIPRANSGNPKEELDQLVKRLSRS